MTEHRFGGEWTQNKLQCVRDYLQAYMRIMKGNANARTFFNTTYVDAFAGTGSIAPNAEEDGKHTHLLNEFDEEGMPRLLKGSARIALEMEPPFDRFIFVEANRARANMLDTLREEYASRKRTISVENSEANEFLREWCKATDWRTNRAVVFLDPYGMQVEWATIEAIAVTHGIDLWVLFPLGIGINRMLKRSEQPPPEWARRLTRFFGTEEWREEFYHEVAVQTLFGEENQLTKDADFDRIGAFFLKRLSGVFAGVAPNPLTLRNSRGNPMYLLCFAAGNPKGAPIAVRIAKHILGAKT